jgi:hypothetical protein
MFRRDSVGPPPIGQRWVRRQVSITAQNIDQHVGEDTFEVLLSPMAWGQINLGTPTSYNKTKSRYSRPQQLLFAWDQYLREVSNGGHDQFLLNSSGLVFGDLQDLMATMGDQTGAQILDQVVRRLGAPPSSDHDQRGKQLADSKARFDDLDQQFYQHDQAAFVRRYVKLHQGDVYFTGRVRKLEPASTFTVRKVVSAFGYALAIVFAVIMMVDGRPSRQLKQNAHSEVIISS